MTEEQTDHAADANDRDGWVAMYRYGQRFRDPQPTYDYEDDGYEDFNPRTEEDTQLNIVEAQMDLLLRFTGASDHENHRDPDSWLDTYYTLAGKWHGRDRAIDEQLESIDHILTQTGGPLWRADRYMPLADVREGALNDRASEPTAAASPAPSGSRLGLAEYGRPWNTGPDPAAGYLRALRAGRQEARESGVPEQSVDTPPLDSSGRFTERARKLSRRVLRPRSTEAHRDTRPPHQSVSGEGMQL